MVQEILGDRNRAADMVNRIELLRRQIYDLRPVLAAEGNAEDLMEAGEALDASLIEVESELIQLMNTGSDGVRWPSMIVGRLRYLQGAVASRGLPSRPTSTGRCPSVLLREQLGEVEEALQAVLAEDLENFNRMLQARIGRVIT